MPEFLAYPDYSNSGETVTSVRIIGSVVNPRHFIRVCRVKIQGDLRCVMIIGEFG